MPVMDEAYVGRPAHRPLDEAERARIDAALAELDQRGIEVDDLEAVGRAYDAACVSRDAGADARAACELFAVAIGEHLDRHSTLRWGVVTDVFGTDLGLAGSRPDTVVVPHNLVASRWMRRETGWIPGVVGHLLRVNAPRR